MRGAKREVEESSSSSSSSSPSTPPLFAGRNTHQKPRVPASPRKEENFLVWRARNYLISLLLLLLLLLSGRRPSFFPPFSLLFSAPRLVCRPLQPGRIRPKAETAATAAAAAAASSSVLLVPPGAPRTLPIRGGKMQDEERRGRVGLTSVFNLNKVHF